MDRIIGIVVLQQEQIIDFSISIVLAIFLGLIIAMVYRYTHRGMNYESGFLSTLVLLAPIVNVVMFFIQGDLVLSLGLVGSLSIIRFRTPIKDTRDMVFLFWSIIIGLGTGTLNWTISIFTTGILTILLTSFYLLKYGRALHAEYILVISGQKSQFDEDIEGIVRRQAANVQLRNHEVEGRNWEITYELRFAREKEKEVRKVVAELQRLDSVDRVSLLTPQLSLPM
ncbi:MAG: DUF4956 domain-containing protein [Spirochaetaceae bacterium]